MPPRVAFRFDIDSITDGGRGIQALIEIARARPGFTATLFVNPGRAIHRRAVLLGIRKTGERVFTGGRKISIRRKLGTGNLLRTLIVNPRIANACAAEIRQVRSAGFEIGLHGGRNHTIWQRQGDSFDRARVREEVNAGLELLDMEHIAGFASPGYTVPASLPQILAELGFLYTTNRADSAQLRVRTDGPIPDIPVNVVGPDTIPLMVSLYAQGHSAEDIVATTLDRIEAVGFAGGIPVIYGHPSEECVILRPLLEKLLAELAGRDFRFLRMVELLPGA
jgi:hypothetical protein